MLVLAAVLAVTLVLSTAGALVAGVHAVARAHARRAPEDARAAARVAGKLALVLAAWLVLAGLLSASGVLSRFEARPPPLMLVVGGAIGLSTYLGRRAITGRLLDTMPRSWPVALQTMRVPIELMLYALFAGGRLPVHLTFEGRNFDILVGLTAPIMAYLVHTGRASGRALLAWNVVSLGLLANIVGMAITSVPGPLHLPWPGPPNTVVTELPFVYLPAFLVPLALTCHVVSLRQLLRLGSPTEGVPQRIGGGL